MTPTPQLSDQARAWLRSSAITDEVIDAAGVWSVNDPAEVPDEFSCYRDHAEGALIFPWRQGDRTELQIGWLDEHRWVGSDGKTVRYRHRKGADMLLNCVRDKSKGPRRLDEGTVLLVEGTKQHLAVASWYPGTVYGFAGAYNWTKADLSFLRDQEVVVLFDGDLRSNRMVHDAASLFMEAADVMGAASVRVGLIPTTSSDGIDDWMAAQPEQARPGMIAKIIEAAKLNLPKPPSKKQTHPFFGEGGLLVDKLSRKITEKHPAALTREEKIALYSQGVYNTDGTAFIGAVAELLEDLFRPGHRAAVEEYTLGILSNAGLVLPDRPTVPLLNLRNGMLDLTTQELLPHDPSYMSSSQLPWEWDPDARAPQYEDWLGEAIPHQADDLEETAATMLDPMRTPSKAVFLYGPSRSGKSTFLRLMGAMAGPQNVSAVTLHQLADDRFAAANVYGKILNTAADLSSSHVEDLSIFKMMTGEDMITANKKYGSQFVFTNKALFAFSANEPPTVGESSRAYTERIKPFRFEKSFAGHEDPAIEARMLSELPGILVRWAEALRRLRGRGQFQPIDTVVRADFEARSDRVRQWVAECCRVVSARDGQFRAVTPGSFLPARDMTTKRDLAQAFNRWAEGQAGSKMGERKIIDRLTSINGVVEVRDEKTRARGLNIIIRSGWADDEDEWAERAVSTHPALNHFSNTEPQTVSEQLEAGGEKKRLRQGGSKLPVLPATPSPLSPGVLPTTPPVQRVSPGQVVCDRLAIDLETGDAGMRTLFSSGPEFIRLAGLQVDDGPIDITTDLPAVAKAVNSARTVIGHNVMGFDLIALARHTGLDPVALTKQGRVLDTKILAMLADPPPAKMNTAQAEKHYSLNSVGDRLLGETKHGDLKVLAKEFGGYDQIPTDDPRYVEYLHGDVSITAQLARVLPISGYAMREHRVAALGAQMTLSGFRVDVDLLRERFEAGEHRRQELVGWLRAEHGLPVSKKDGKPSAAPQATQEGKAAIEAAFVAAGLAEELIPRTPTGAMKLDQTTMTELIEAHGEEHPGIVDIMEAVQGLNGIRSVYGTVTDNLVGDRVHPSVSMRQATGRWSITKPGLTVFGKRKGKAAERAIFLPDEDHVLISADLSQIDARAVAAWSQDDNYLAAFEPGKDLHTEVAKMVFGDASKREQAKVISHGANYGLGIEGLLRQQPSIRREDAERFYAMQSEMFPGVAIWKDHVRSVAEVGGLLDNGFGRKLRVNPNRAYTQAPALVGQACARDLMMEGLLRLPADVVPMIRAVVHDEVVLSVPKDDVFHVEQLVMEAMSFEWAPPGLSKTIRVEAGLAARGLDWAGCYGPEYGRVAKG